MELKVLIGISFLVCIVCFFGSAVREKNIIASIVWGVPFLFIVLWLVGAIFFALRD